LIKKLQAILTDGITRAAVPGAIVEIITPDWRWSYAAGYASLSPELPAEPWMHFFIASVKKGSSLISVGFK